MKKVTGPHLAPKDRPTPKPMDWKPSESSTDKKDPSRKMGHKESEARWTRTAQPKPENLSTEKLNFVGAQEEVLSAVSQVRREMGDVV